MNFHEANCEDHWPFILPGLKEALQFQKERLTEAQVWIELQARRASLLLCKDGFVITKVEQRTNGDRCLLIWFAYSHAKVSVIDKYKNDIDEVAAAMDCNCIEFVSTRRGYERRVPEGWEMVHTRWRKQLK